VATKVQPFFNGIIEGFFGIPWDWSARLAAVDFLGTTADSFYIYAPKADAFLRRRWREPYPDSVTSHLRELSERCRSRGVAFGVGLTPYEIYLNYDQPAREALNRKVVELNALGVTWLAVLFDDMRGDFEGSAELQARVLADIAGWTTADRLMLCPTYYSSDPLLEKVFGRMPPGYLEDLTRIIDPRVDVFWTGEKVISGSYTAAHLDAVNRQLGRKPFIWDNSGSNDARSRTERLFLNPASSGWTLPRDLASGVAFNLMNEPYLSLLSLRVYLGLLLRANTSKKPLDSAALFRSTCLEVAGANVGGLIVRDAARFNSDGRIGSADGQRNNVLEDYEAHEQEFHARDVCNWLRGKYVFDPACLTI